MTRLGQILIAGVFALLSAIPLGGVVVCVDHDGHVQVETSCDASACCPAAECAMAEDVPRDDHPCTDIPVSLAPESRSRGVSRAASQHELRPVSFVLAGLAGAMPAAEPAMSAAGHGHGANPAQSATIRCVVLRI